MFPLLSSVIVYGEASSASVSPSNTRRIWATMTNRASTLSSGSASRAVSARICPRSSALTGSSDLSYSMEGYNSFGKEKVHWIGFYEKHAEIPGY